MPGIASAALAPQSSHCRPGRRVRSSEVGDRGAEHDVDAGGERAVEQRVADHPAGIGEARARNAAACTRPGSTEKLHTFASDSSRSPRCGESTSASTSSTQPYASTALPPVERPLAQRRSAARERRVVAPLRDPRGQRERADREHDHDERDHVADRILEPDRGDAQVRLRRQHVGDVQHERRAEIVEHLDEHQRGARDEARRGEREHDAAEQPEAVAAEVLRRFLHRAVDVAERGRRD